MVGWEVALAPSTQLWICLSDGHMQNKSAEQMTHAFGLVKGHKEQILLLLRWGTRKILLVLQGGYFTCFYLLK